ncbi:MAG: polysaccharide export protein [Nitrococcus sp.]|nr:polysaccharide export protein [Nitrococcus sp.]
MDEIYRLGTGDVVKVTVFGEENLSGEFTVDDAGAISMPLIGPVEAANKTPRELAASVTARLKNGYLRNPRVSTQIVGYRPFYIYGEVQEPGNYPFTLGLNVIEAVATAGGYTYRADQDEVYITRKVDGESQQFSAPPGARVFPGDIIKVPERYF